MSQRCTATEREPAAAPAAILRRKCPTCEEQASPGGGGNSAQAEASADLAPPIVHEALQSKGEPLDSATLSRMGRNFGHDFSSVRVHHDGAAARSARAIAASAYTVGSDVVFAQGRYAPHTPGGTHLLAHELAHVIQQGSSARRVGGPIAMGSASDPAEQEADKAAAAANSGLQCNVSATVPRKLQKQAELGGIPCALDAYRVDTRSIDLQPVVFRSSAADASPTGASWNRRFGPSNRIWNKLAVTFNALSTVTLTDATNKTRGSTDAEANTIGALHSGAGIEIYMVDNPMTSSGGASTLSAGTASNIVMSDGGTSDTLLAHELGHVLGLGHPPADGDAGTIMDPSGSRDATNPERNTIGNYNRITFPPGGSITCIKPDP